MRAGFNLDMQQLGGIHLQFPSDADACGAVTSHMEMHAASSY